MRTSSGIHGQAVNYGDYLHRIFATLTTLVGECGVTLHLGVVVVAHGLFVALAVAVTIAFLILAAYGTHAVAIAVAVLLAHLALHLLFQILAVACPDNISVHCFYGF